ncbi:MAG: hypothetical protein CL878_01225 [Dehalococcoidia bacterium]|nr:hypothetical protein [Dehalococcoidia bacterium]
MWLLVGGLVAVAGLLWTAPPRGVDAQGIQPTPTLPFFFFEDNDPYMTYGGNWSTVANALASGGTEHESRTENAIVTFIFNGRYVKWFATKGPNRGQARVLLDNVEIASSPVDLYASSVQHQRVVVWIDSLDESVSHTLEIQVMDRRNGSATDSIVSIDAFEVLSAPRMPVTPTPSPTPFPTATLIPTATLPPLPTASPTPAFRPGAWPIDLRFLRYYADHDGPRILGNSIGSPTLFAGNFAQYFEKGRIEDHPEQAQSAWRFQYGLLVDELHQVRAPIPVGGDSSTVTYGTVNDLAGPQRRLTPPAGFEAGIGFNDDGSVFIPFSADLASAPGHNVSPVFWEYMQREDLFPAGWLHDIGLPLTEAIPATVDKGVLRGRQILVQAFQRTILTYDALNPTEFQVERANVGSDYRRVFLDRVPQ